jgi:hypothetical protein
MTTILGQFSPVSSGRANGHYLLANKLSNNRDLMGVAGGECIIKMTFFVLLLI